MERRSILKGLSAMTVVVVGGSVWRACDQGVFSTGRGVAYEPWADWRSAESGDSMDLVRSAILAASPHNTQPWRFHVTESRIDLFAETTRGIGSTDPYLREMYIGLGCALENLLQAARANGYRYELTMAPSVSDPTSAARIDLTRGEMFASEFYSAIPRRHTNRGRYDRSRKISAGTFQSLEAVIGDEPDVRLFWITDDDELDRAGDLIVEATEAIIADHDQSHDSARWYRFDWNDAQRHRDGLTLDAMGGSAMFRAAAKILPRQSHERNDQYWLKATREVHTATAAAFGILAVPDQDDLAHRLSCGRAWQRMHLWATTQGLAMQPLNQLPERSAREQVLKLEPKFGQALRRLIGDQSWQALMVFRAGYPVSEALPSPRRAVESVII